MNTERAWPPHFHLIGAGMRDVPADAGVEQLGMKAWNLARMARMGLAVPEALVIGTHHAAAPDDALLPLMSVALPALEDATGLRLGHPAAPLIVSVRSGAAVSMPGMLETLLNVGLCDSTVSGLIRLTGHPRLAWDAYRRLVACFGETVQGLPAGLFEDELQRATAGRDERRLDFAELRDLTRRFLFLYEQASGEAFPQDPRVQVASAVRAVFRSWDAPKARAYRRSQGLDDAIGTAVTLQRMVFGNAGGASGSGVGFTRDPSTGEARLWVDFLANAQGEDVVSGRRDALGHSALERLAPQAWDELCRVAGELERAQGDMQDFEFTVEQGRLYLLQTRNGKRTARAAARIALDLLDEGLIDAVTAMERTRHIREQDLGTTVLAAGDGAGPPIEPLARAVVAGPGAATGAIALDAQGADRRVSPGTGVVLVRQDADTRDVEALEHADGLLTARGARTSHAAVVARQMGKVCLVGCEGLRIDLDRRTVAFCDRTFREGDVITLDGASGRVYPGSVGTRAIVDAELVERLRRLREAGSARSGARTQAVSS